MMAKTSNCCIYHYRLKFPYIHAHTYMPTSCMMVLGMQAMMHELVSIVPNWLFWGLTLTFIALGNTPFVIAAAITYVQGYMTPSVWAVYVLTCSALSFGIFAGMMDARERVERDRNVKLPKV